MVSGGTSSMEGDVTASHGPPDFWLVKLDAVGELQWQRCYGGTGAEEPTRSLATSDGGYLLMGKTWSANGDVECDGNLQHAWALKVDGLGEPQWETCLSGDPNGSAASINQAVETDDGGYLVVGSTYAQQGIWSGNHGQTDFFAAKLDGTGQVEWLHCYGGTQVDEAWSVVRTSDGNYAIAGMSKSSDGQVSSGSSGQVWVIKIDPEGNLLWNRRMGGSAVPFKDDGVKDLVANPDGSMLVVAYTASNDGDISGHHGGYDAWLVVLDADGTMVRQRCFGGSGDEEVWAATASNWGRCMLVGTTGSNDGDVSGNHGGNGLDVWVFSVDANLNLVWQKSMGGIGGEEGFGVARNTAGEIFTSGQAYYEDGDISGIHGAEVDIWVVKLSSDLTLGLEGHGLESGFFTYPSPAHSCVNVSFPARLPSDAVLDVIDVAGRVVQQKRIASGTQSMQLSVEGWANGVYCLRLDLGSGFRTTRFMKQ